MAEIRARNPSLKDAEAVYLLERRQNSPEPFSLVCPPSLTLPLPLRKPVASVSTNQTCSVMEQSTIDQLGFYFFYRLSVELRALIGNTRLVVIISTLSGSREG
jgi:hypothetical protein